MIMHSKSDTGSPPYSRFFWGRRKPRKLKSAEIGELFSTKPMKWGKHIFKVQFLTILHTVKSILLFILHSIVRYLLTIFWQFGVPFDQIVRQHHNLLSKFFEENSNGDLLIFNYEIPFKIAKFWSICCWKNSELAGSTVKLRGIEIFKKPWMCEIRGYWNREYRGPLVITINFKSVLV